MRISHVAATLALVSATALSGCASDTGQSRDQTSTPAQPESGSVWVADEGGDSLTVLDAAGNTVAATLTGIKGPHNVQVGRDGDTVYAVSGGTHQVVAIDAAKYTVRAVAPTGSGPAHVIEAPNGKVYVTNADDGTVSVYQGTTLAPAGAIELGGMPHGLRAADGGSVIVVANHHTGKLDLIDPNTDRPTAAVSVGIEPVQVAVSADGRYAYSSVTEPPSVVKVDLTSRTVVGSVAVPTPPVQLYLTPDGKSVLSANQGTAQQPGDTMSVIDTAAMTSAGTVQTGSGPHGVVLDDTGTRAWITNTFADTVSAIDVSTLSASATIPVGKSPNGISFSPRTPATPPSATVTLDVPVPASAPSGGGGHGH